MHCKPITQYFGLKDIKSDSNKTFDTVAIHIFSFKRMSE